MTSGELTPMLLVVDDDPAIFPIVDRIARRLGFDTEYRNNGAAALESIEEVAPTIVLVDLRMPEMDGIGVLRRLRQADPDCQVALMTGEATIDSAVEAVKAGALDYLTKPFDLARLESLLVQVRDALARRVALVASDAELARRLQFHGLVGRSAAMQSIFEQIARFAPHTRSALVTGDTGTGKDLIARAIHAAGPRAAGPFVVVNSSLVLEAFDGHELFGRVVTGAATEGRGVADAATARDDGAGAFERADGGTVFLDRVDELPTSLQARLFGAVETGDVQRVGASESRRVDVCVIAASSRDLRAEAASGAFRSDLYYRLSRVEIRVPPLVERREDIPYLIAVFVRGTAERLGREIAGVTSAAEDLLRRAPWPGNVRELRHVIERACLLTDGRMLTEREIAAAMSAPGPSPIDAAAAGDANLLTTAQREQIARVLGEVGGNKVAAAKRLGISRRSLYRWIERLGIGA